MYDNYTAEDEELIEIHAIREQIDVELETDGQAILESMMFHGFDR